MASALAKPRPARRRRRHRDDARAQIGPARAADDRRPLGQSPRRPRPLPCPDRVRAALRRLYVARDNDAAGLKAANRLHDAASRPVSKSASSCRSMATSTSICAVSAREACWRICGPARPLRPDALFARCQPLRSAAVAQPHFGSLGAAPEGRRACGAAAGASAGERSRACGLPERRSAGGDAGLQWRRPTIFRRRADRPRVRHGSLQ